MLKTPPSRAEPWVFEKVTLHCIIHNNIPAAISTIDEAFDRRLSISPSVVDLVVLEMARRGDVAAAKWKLESWSCGPHARLEVKIRFGPTLAKKMDAIVEEILDAHSVDCSLLSDHLDEEMEKTVRQFANTPLHLRSIARAVSDREKCKQVLPLVNALTTSST